MKKALLLAAVLLGAATASQAGVHLNIGIPLPPLPLPPLPGITFGRPAPRAYYQAPPAYYEAPSGYYQAPPPVCYDAPVVVAPPSFYFGFGPRDYGYRDYGYRGYRGSRGWDRHQYSYRGSDHYRGGHDDGHHRR